MAITAEDTAMYNEAKGEYIEEVCRMLDTPDLTTETVLLNVMGCLKNAHMACADDVDNRFEVRQEIELALELMKRFAFRDIEVSDSPIVGRHFQACISR